MRFDSLTQSHSRSQLVATDPEGLRQGVQFPGELAGNLRQHLAKTSIVGAVQGNVLLNVLTAMPKAIILVF